MAEVFSYDLAGHDQGRALPSENTRVLITSPAAPGVVIPLASHDGTWLAITKAWQTYWPKTHAKISGATMVASLSIMNFGVLEPSLPHVIFSFGTAPE